MNPIPSYLLEDFLRASSRDRLLKPVQNFAVKTATMLRRLALELGQELVGNSFKGQTGHGFSI
jgi:hypothetical protein